eukprot:GFYU01015994.1.p2 GENE.GFYU01015994.1~~GFYU01015994.1.p2  ORF type:complete len:108 (+),score=31.49 GFYU01015994.1:75-398(+)
MLIICVSVYFCCTCLMQFVTFVWEDEAICFTKAKDKLGPCTISSSMQRYDDAYTLTIQDLNSKRTEAMTKSVTNYFDVTGYFVSSIWEKDVKEFIEKFEAGESKKTK